jgi:hypothetical protein
MKILLAAALLLLFTDTCTVSKTGDVSLSNITCNKPYAVTLSTAYTYTHVPPGLYFNPTSGLLSGTVPCTGIGMPVPTIENPGPQVVWTITATPKAQ